MNLLENSPRRRRTVVAAAVIAVSLAGAGSAQGAVTLGSSLQDTTVTSAPCDVVGGCAVVHEAIYGRTTAAPHAGVIVRWRVRGQGAFAIFPATYVGDDTIVRGAAGPTQRLASMGVGTFPARIPIAKGQHVGLIAGQGSRAAGRTPALVDLDGWSPTPPPSATVAQGRDTRVEFGYNVDIEPDADGDGHGDETQDGCPADRNVQGACPQPPAPDTTAPAFTVRPAVRPSRPRAGRRFALRFAISEAAKVSAIVERRRGGRYRRVRAISKSMPAGGVAVRARLRAGRYRLTLRATDPAGNTARTRVFFRVRR